MGNFTLTASSTGLTSATTSSFALTAGVASKLAVTTQPSTTVANAVALAAQPVLTVQDASGNTVTTSSAPIILSVASGSGALACTTNPVNASSGIATFAGCALTGTVGNYTLTATSTALTSATTNTVTLTVGAASKLAFTTQPIASATANANFTTQPVVTVQDSGGNKVTSTASITLTASTGTFSCTTNPLSAVAGVATFAGCKDSVSNATFFTTNYLTAASTGLTSATTTTTGANQLVITVQPVAAINGTAFTTQPVVAVADARGNVITSATNAVTLAAVPGGAALTCTTNPVTAVAGIATFAGCTFTGAVGPSSFTARATGLTTDTSTSITVVAGVAGAAAQLAFTSAPFSSGASNSALNAFTVSVVDANGNPTTTGTATTVNLTSTSASPIFATTSGGAGVTSVSIPANTQSVTAYYGDTKAASPTLTAVATGLTSDTQVETITYGPAAKVVFTTQPACATVTGFGSSGCYSSGAFGNSTGVFSTQPVAAIQDAYGNTVTTSAASVQLTASAGTLTCTTNPVTAVSGVATFANCKDTSAENSTTFTVTAASAGLTSAVSAGF